MISLQKGQEVSLTKEAPEMRRILIGLGWRVQREFPGYDLDAFALLLRDGKLKDDSDIVYYGALNHPSGAVVHQGVYASRGDSDDIDVEQIAVDLDKMPEDVTEIVIAVNIYKTKERNQTFDGVDCAYVRLVDENGTPVVKYPLTEGDVGCTTMIFGKIYRHDGEWKFNALGQGTEDKSIDDVAARFK